MTSAPLLREGAEALSATLPPLMADAEHLASTVLLGAHGRRRSGMGDEFWQYRQALPGDAMRGIDWRRSARSEDVHFVREKEWQAAQTVDLWVDRGQSMTFASTPKLATKGLRARLLGLASAILLIRAGERVSMTGSTLQPRSGEVQITRIAAALAVGDAAEDYASPEARGMLPRSRALFLSDFLGQTEGVTAALAKAADRGVRGSIVQILDPAEEAFPFDGRTRFQSMTGAIEFETLRAGNLRDRYLDRLAARKAELADLARATGWQYLCHHTDAPAQGALLWIYQALGKVR